MTESLKDRRERIKRGFLATRGGKKFDPFDCYDGHAAREIDIDTIAEEPTENFPHEYRFS